MKWIKCTEQQPADNNMVLVYSLEYGICKAKLSDEIWYYSPASQYAIDNYLCDVTHWAPLPEVPDEVD